MAETLNQPTDDGHGAAVARLTSLHGLPVIADEKELSADIAAAGILFFPGDDAGRPEIHDVAVILPELLATFAGRVRAAVVRGPADEPLRARYGILTVPALAFLRDGVCIAAIPRVADWSAYVAAAIRVAEGRPS